MLRSLRNLGRLVRVARILGRHDALQVLEDPGLAPGLTRLLRLFVRRRTDQPLGVRLAQAAEDLGPSFIKLGQALSTRADLLGTEVAADLSRLRDDLPPFPAAAARAVIAAELGVPVTDLFDSFDDTPVAAASIAQVHFAVTTDGGAVAVKVLRPGIERAFARDLDLLFWIAEWLERARPKWRRLRPVDTVRTFAEVVRVEMDLRLEAAAADELAENFADDAGYVVPAVDWSRTAQRVLTTERIHGVPIDQPARLAAAGHDPDAVMEIAARAMFTQVFRDGFFHGDPHPGNLFVDDEGRINAVDFGIMGRLDEDTRRYLADMLLAFLNRDYGRVADIHFRAGLVPADKSRGAFAQALRSIAEPILDLPAKEISVGKLLGHLFQTTETFGMRTQPHLLLLQKVMVVAEGVGRSLNPEANMWQVARPLIEDWMARNMGPDARVRAAVADAVETAQRLPRMIEQADQLLSATAARTDEAALRDRQRAALNKILVYGLGGAVLALLLALALD